MCASTSYFCPSSLPLPAQDVRETGALVGSYPYLYEFSVEQSPKSH